MGAAMIAGLAVPQAQAATGRRAVPAAGPRVTRGAADRGAVKRTQSVTVRVYLAPRGGEAALKSAVAAVSDPASAAYHQYLTPAQFRARYRPTASAIRAVSGWLRSGGLKVKGIDASGRYVTATGDAAAAEKAFATTLHTFSKGGDRFRAPVRGATVPGAVAGKVLAVSGLSTATHRMRPRATFPDGFVNARPCSQYYGQVPATYKADFKTPLPKFNRKTIPYSPCGYQPAQFRAAYEGATTLTGAGQTVAITDAYAAPTILADANQYATRHGDPAFGKTQFAQRNPKKFTDQEACDSTGWYGEETLDVEAVHAMAPARTSSTTARRAASTTTSSTPCREWSTTTRSSIVTNSWGDSRRPRRRTASGPTSSCSSRPRCRASVLVLLRRQRRRGAEHRHPAGGLPGVGSLHHRGGRHVDGIGGNGALAGQTGWGTDKWNLTRQHVDPGRLPLRRRRRLLESVQPARATSPRSSRPRGPTRLARRAGRRHGRGSDDGHARR